MKRKASEITKKFDKDEFISPSNLKNYILHDPLIDYLEYYKINTLNELPNRKRANSVVDGEFVQFIKLKGIDFENKIINEFKYPIVKINGSININNFNETVNAIKNNHPIIYQGVLIDFENKTYGQPDLIIRGDYLKLLYQIDYVKNDCYYIIDIKYSTINLSSDETFILNSDFIPTYKSQVFLYTKMLNNILNQNVNEGFILGKKYVFTKNNIKNTSSHKLGLINYKTRDIEYTYLVDQAINWVHRLRNEGHNWVLLPRPSVYELYPNMSNNKDGKWRPLKTELSEELKELTLILNVGHKERTKAFSQNIFSYDDDRCNSSTLGLCGKIGDLVDNIININKNNTDIILPKKITSTYWRQVPNNQFEFFIDYETTSDFENNNIIFMIGVGYYDNKWIFKSFKTDDSSIEAQKKMFDNFWHYINGTSNGLDPLFIHWTQAEPTFYKKIQQKLPNLSNKNFLDLYKVFIDEPITIKGALNYSLKTIAKAMYNHKLINTSWETNSLCNNGLDALVQAHKIYFNNERKLKEIKDIIKYNEIDCKVLYEIIDYLRKNH